jgi:hypothetical protein
VSGERQMSRSSSNGHLTNSAADLDLLEDRPNYPDLLGYKSAYRT